MFKTVEVLFRPKPNFEREECCEELGSETSRVRENEQSSTCGLSKSWSFSGHIVGIEDA